MGKGKQRRLSRRKINEKVAKCTKAAEHRCNGPGTVKVHIPPSTFLGIHFRLKQLYIQITYKSALHSGAS